MTVGVPARGIFTALAGVLTVISSANEPPPISHNPFSRPTFEAISEVRSPNLRQDVVPGVIDLRATLVASNDRLANIAGRILRPGEEVHGYKLLYVYEDRAIFERQGRQFVIYVKPTMEQEAVGENDD